MTRLAASASVLVLCVAASTAAAQTRAYDPYDPYQSDPYQGRDYGYEEDGYARPQEDYARVLDVRPVFESRVRPVSGERCYERRDGYARDDYARGGYRRDDGDYAPDDGYVRDGYRAGRGTEAGRTMATVIGGVVGAVLGSQVGGGSARYATSAIGSMVGGIAGQKVYENGVRERGARGTVTVCEPDSRYGRYETGGSGVSAYDVTYEYAGRQYTTRTPYHPGDRIRVRVDVQPDQ